METNRSTAKSLAAIIVLAFAGGLSSGNAAAQSNPVRLTSDTSTVNRNISQSVERLEMLVKSSRILTLEERIPKFQVHNEGILGATPVSQNQIQIFAKAPGTTQLNLWDTNDKLYTVDVTVSPDAREVEGILANQLPLASLKVLPVNNSAIISGTVTNVDEVDRAVAIVEQFYATVVNNIRVVGVQQVLLHTKIMEVSRTKLRDMGIDWGSFTDTGFFYNAPGGLLAMGETTVNGAIPTTEGGLSATNRIFAGGGDFDALVTALRRQDLIKFLAEPTVVATHGRPARFNVGGKVPYLVPSGNGAISVQYEEFGTSVDFLPFVVGPGRVRLEVRPEVSEPDASNGIVAAGVNVTAFRSRYVETAVELQAGQTFAIAGLLQSRTESVTRATPFFGELPYIGTMFRRVREERNDIELLITVTPEFVSAMDPHEVPRGGPGLNSMSPNDCELYLKGHIEVPNLLGDDCGCSPGNDGYSTGASQGYGSVINPNEIHGGVVLPPGAIVPGNQPIQVGEGVTISSPN
ncbi:type II and III secretion system protein family protein [Rubripirellula reticaptiva]|uniref:Putative type II secretion system protein D n=1 Tax=Rubripirellula reticaptiva TaxID=2528013 RepID=A0A5C6EP21_9BACT|nr:pilus assembly protein N-terminal domain-containing protein [Rubripirellula reticaptiva]TWU49366.1 putative type II secretion system protein D precursor [Rubripirellula reticaptiva]